MECMCAWTRPRFILSSERVLGNGLRTHVNFQGKVPSFGTNLPKGGSNPQSCVKQDSEPNTLLTELFWPLCMPLTGVPDRSKGLAQTPRHRWSLWRWWAGSQTWNRGWPGGTGAVWWRGVGCPVACTASCTGWQCCTHTHTYIHVHLGCVMTWGRLPSRLYRQLYRLAMLYTHTHIHVHLGCVMTWGRLPSRLYRQLYRLAMLYTHTHIYTCTLRLCDDVG